MDSFEWNKIAGAVLFALLLSVGLSILSDVIFETEAPETPGYIVAVATEEGAPEDTAAASQPIEVLLANADPDAGAAAAKKCGACHTFEGGGPNKVGPNLWSVVNRPIASHEGYEYGDAMHAFAEQAGTWTYEHLNTYLTDPKATVPGTKMAFAGLKSDTERANVIAYLRTLSDNPAPLPAAGAAEAQSETQVASTEPQAPAAEPQPAAEPPAAAPDAAASAPAEAPAEQPAAAPQAVAQAEAPAAEAAPAPPAAGDAAKGAAFAKRCAACHSFENGGPNQVGPNLFGVANRPIASVPNYSYSEAMVAFSEGGAKKWDEAALDTYLADPKGVVPGTKMAFPGVKKEPDRANLIAYLKTLTE